MERFLRGPLLCLFAALLMGAPGCALKLPPRTPEDFRRETLRLEDRGRNHKDPGVRAESRRELAALSLSHRNPKRHYGKALREFEAYLEETPGQPKSDGDLDWVAALQEMEKREKETLDLRERVRGLNREKEEMVRSQAALAARSQELSAAAARLQERVEALEKANRGLVEANRALIEANRALKEENERAKDTLEKLRALDRQMEEKRRTIR